SLFRGIPPAGPGRSAVSQNTPPSPHRACLSIPGKIPAGNALQRYREPILPSGEVVLWNQRTCAELNTAAQAPYGRRKTPLESPKTAIANAGRFPTGRVLPANVPSDRRIRR